MARYVAFLRAINVGGHNVKMEELRRLFAEVGLSDVATFIASGNVIFETRARDIPALERKIEAHLREALGYDVATFVRSTSELASVAAHDPFPDAGADEASLHVAFLPSPPDEQAREKLMSRRTEVDDFHVHGREIYWRCRVRVSESAFSGAVLEKTIRMPATLRNVTTVRRLAALHPAAR
jgi:uncharacterized protein (DUF1697 family)